MKAVLDRLASGLAAHKTVRISDCAHFCAYRYGRDEINPYETYARGLARERPLDEIRAEFADYLRHFRPAHLSEALGVPLSREYPLGYLPWRTPRQVSARPGWHPRAADIVDVMTYFSAEGIPASGLHKEFAWHENAFLAMRRDGYQPRRFGYITVRELRGTRSVYLVTDGNHRLSALSALGHVDVIVAQPPGAVVDRGTADRWPLVKAGLVDLDDALRIFDAYLDGHAAPLRTMVPTAVV